MRRHPGDELRVLIGGLAVAAGGLAARHGHVFAFDTNLFRLVNELPDALGRPLLVVMHLGALAAVPAMAGVALAARRPRLSRDLALSGGLAWLLANMVKDVVGEARPVALLGGVVVCAFTTGAGYPSGHAAVAAAMATAAGPWLQRPARRAVWWVAWLVALGRMYAGVHLPLDVAGGMALGWAVAAAAHLAVGVPGGCPRRPRSWRACGRPGWSRTRSSRRRWTRAGRSPSSSAPKRASSGSSRRSAASSATPTCSTSCGAGPCTGRSRTNRRSRLPSRQSSTRPISSCWPPAPGSAPRPC